MPERTTVQLGPQARRVLALAMQGRSDKEIAQELGITPVTVRTHFARLCARYGATNRCQLAHLATADLGTVSETKRDHSWRGNA